MVRQSTRFRSVPILLFACVFALLLGVLVPAFTATAFAAPSLQPPAQAAEPIPNSIVPALVQLLLIVLVTQGLKSLVAALGGQNADGTPKVDISGQAAAYAYIVVGLVVFALGYFLPQLPAGVSDFVTSILGVLATLLAGSGLFSMTAVFRSSR